MKKYAIPLIVIIAVMLAAKFFVFRGGPPPGARGPGGPPVVKTAEIAEIETNEVIQATGRIEAPFTVDIRPRVEGYLEKAYFEEGSYVNKGDLLFLIGQRPFQVVVNKAAADVQETLAALDEAEKNVVRIVELVEKDYASKAQQDQIIAQRDRLNALLEAKKAALEQAEINLGYTRIYAKISGKIGRITMDEGNVVSPAIGTLAKIVSLNPIYVNFNITDEEYLQLKKQNKATAANEIEITLPDGSVYPEKGKIVFYDNEIESATGTIAVRAEVNNLDYLLLPGQYVNVAMFVGKTQSELAVPQEAVLETPQGKTVYVLEKDNIVNIRPILTKKRHNGFWTVEKGLEKGEIVVVQGLQKLMPGIKVVPEKEQVKKDEK